MMFPLVNRFNPNNGQPLPTSNGEVPLEDCLHEHTAGFEDQDCRRLLFFSMQSTQ